MGENGEMDAAHSGKPEVGRLHAEWEAVHEELRKLEKALSESLSLYARGQASRPDQVIAQVEGMRADCAEKFRALMAAVKKS